jgi:hypothetical protein
MKLKHEVLSVVMTGLVLTSLTACGGGPQQTSNNPYGTTPQPRGGGIFNNKAVLLSGAAALYYLYQKNHEMRKAGEAVPRYYLSRNGRVYYRDKSGLAHWVTPPAGGVTVPPAIAERYKDFQGYDGQSTGRDMAGLARQLY